MKKKNNISKLILTSLLAAALLIIAFSIKTPDSSSNNSKNGSNMAEKVVDGDIVIPVSEVSDKVRFYPAEINGIELEAMAVRASDGTIRTAFNTCQVCYSSGRGYYKQDGNELVCANCGNRFSMDDIEVSRGGCNPVPITDDYKTVNDDEIIIYKEFLEQASVIFQNWK